jgi:hypothetical protein
MVPFAFCDNLGAKPAPDADVIAMAIDSRLAKHSSVQAKIQTAVSPEIGASPKESVGKRPLNGVGNNHNARDSGKWGGTRAVEGGILKCEVPRRL